MIGGVPTPLRRAAILLVLLIVAGCATEQGIPGNRPVGSDQPSTVTPPEALPPEVVTPSQNPPLVTRPQQPPAGGFPKSLKESGAGAGVIALAKQAQDSKAAGKFDAAVGQLERALRIEPRNPFIWQALADAHLQLQHADQAESAAQKSSSLGRGNPYLEAGNWRVISAARVLKGDGAGARIASTHADEISAGLSAAP